MNFKDKPAKRDPVHIKAFLFSFLGAFCGGFLYLMIYHFTDTNAGVIFLLSGLGAYCFYLFFTDPNSQRGIHYLFHLISTMLSAILTQFIFIFWFITPYVNEYTFKNAADMSRFQKTIAIYKFHINSTDFVALYQFGNWVFQLIGIIVISWVGLGISILFLNIIWKGKYNKNARSKDSSSRTKAVRKGRFQ